MTPPPALDPDEDFWVFAYGSLMWRPGFAVAEVQPARLGGYHRRFCIWSTRYRGTPARPGLVLGLDRGGACRGLALRVPRREAAEVLAYLDEREMFDHVYFRRRLPVQLVAAGTAAAPVSVRAVTYVVDRAHHAYAPPMPAERIASVIAEGHGESGANRDYLLNTIAHLAEIGVRDRMLAAVARWLPAAGQEPMKAPGAGQAPKVIHKTGPARTAEEP